MAIFRPTTMEKRVYNITKQKLDALGVSALLLDVDNTLTTDNNPVPDAQVLSWIEEMKQAGIKLLIMSNNHSARVEPFARLLGLGYVANACKPLPFRINRAIARLGLTQKQVAMVGDQLFTDMAVGNLCGCHSILVEPMEFETRWFFRFKRSLEKILLRSYRKRGI